MRDETYSYLIEQLGQPTLKREVPTTVLNKFNGVVPDKLLTYWETEGFNQFKGGIYSTVNPEDWQGVVDDWIKGTVFEQFGRFYAISRGAFGRLSLFNPLIGATCTIYPEVGELRASSVALREPKRITSSLLGLFAPDHERYSDVLDDQDKALYTRALKRLGPLDWNEMYAFEPSRLLGGAPRLDNLVKVDAIVHCSLLRKLIDTPFVPFTDIGQALGVNCAELALEAIAEHKLKLARGA